jgi:hypothetical protein
VQDVDSFLEARNVEDRQSSDLPTSFCSCSALANLARPPRPEKRSIKPSFPASAHIGLVRMQRVPDDAAELIACQQTLRKRAYLLLAA